MKKYILICCSILLLTACSEPSITKQTECTINNEVDGIKVDGTYVLTYTDEYIDTVKFTEKYTVSEEYLIPTVEETFDALYKDLGELKYYYYNRKTEGLSVTSTVSIDYNRINIQELTKLNADLKKIIKDDKIEAKLLIESYESSGATCKEKN